MANEQNLKPLTTKKAREIGKKGGIASGKKRRELKTLKEELLILLAEGDTQEKISLAVIQKALQGDLKAFEVIRDTTGQKAVEKVEISQTVDDSIKEIEKYMSKKCKKK
jgi:hypothetical protein